VSGVCNIFFTAASFAFVAICLFNTCLQPFFSRTPPSLLLLSAFSTRSFETTIPSACPSRTRLAKGRGLWCLGSVLAVGSLEAKELTTTGGWNIHKNWPTRWSSSPRKAEFSILTRPRITLQEAASLSSGPPLKSSAPRSGLR